MEAPDSMSVDPDDFTANAVESTNTVPSAEAPLGRSGDAGLRVCPACGWFGWEHDMRPEHCWGLTSYGRVWLAGYEYGLQAVRAQDPSA
jgi:hypothetical protein